MTLSKNKSNATVKKGKFAIDFLSFRNYEKY